MSAPSAFRVDLWITGSMLLLALTTVPIFLCLPLTADTIHYDLQARCVLAGGILYQDVLEPNLPGVVWIHLFVRSLAGWSSEVLRGVDLLILIAIAWLWTRCLRDVSPAAEMPAEGGLASQRTWVNSTSTRNGMLFLLLWWCYISLPEWCHCQRDIWLILPALGAIQLRLARLGRIADEADRDTTHGMRAQRDFMACVVEGLLWGLAFWLKPFVAVPALFVWIMSRCVMGTLPSSLPLVRDLAGTLSGGVLAGLAGSIWLWDSGAWAAFWETALHWNPEYFASRQNRWTPERMATLYRWLTPWWWAHLMAAPLAVAWVAQGLKNRGEVPLADRTRVVCAACYLGWMVQVLCLQHPLLYIHASGVLMAIPLVVDEFCRRWGGRPSFRTAVLVAGGMLLLLSPALRPDRLVWWERCLREGPTPRIQNALQHSPLIDRERMQQVAEFLRDQGLADRELTVYSGYLIPLYALLDVTPSTRYYLLDVEARVFPSRVGEITEALERSPQRFVVSNLIEAGLPWEEAVAAERSSTPQLPAGFPENRRHEFPYNQTLVFRSGPLLVHQVTNPVGQLTTDYLPLAP